MSKLKKLLIAVSIFFFLSFTQLALSEPNRSILEVQQKLISLGYDPGLPDGILGDRTTRAIRAYQTENNIPVTGILDMETLASLGIEVSVERLLADVRDADDDKRVRIFNQLIAIGPTAVMPLLSTVQDEDPYIRYFSIYTLARIADVRAMDNLVKALGDTKPNVRREAAIGLGNLRDRSAIDPLSRTATFDDSYEVRIWAIRSLKKIGGSEIISPLISLLNRQGDDFNGHFDDLRKFVSEEILEIGTSAIEFLLTALEEGNLNIRKSVLAILDKFEKIDDSKRFLAARDNLMRDLKLFTEARGIVSSAFSSGGNGPNNHIDYGSFTLKSDAVTNLPSFQRLEKLKTEGAFKGVSRIYIFNLADVEGESTLTKVSNLFDKSEDYHVTISAKKDLQKIYFDNVGSGFAGYFRVSKVTFCFYDEVSADNFVRGWKTLIEMFRSPEAR